MQTDSNTLTYVCSVNCESEAFCQATCLPITSSSQGFSPPQPHSVYSHVPCSLPLPDVNFGGCRKAVEQCGRIFPPPRKLSGEPWKISDAAVK